MNKVVEAGLKIDLHIHSAFSRDKDGKKVANNTVENIQVLISKLSENDVNICAITDHDAFSYKMYRALKAAEEQNNSVMKVLPGAEFSVAFCHEGIEKVLHVVTIFSDLDDEKVKRMESVLKENRPNKNGAYTEEALLALLRKSHWIQFSLFIRRGVFPAVLQAAMTLMLWEKRSSLSSSIPTILRHSSLETDEMKYSIDHMYESWAWNRKFDS